MDNTKDANGKYLGVDDSLFTSGAQFMPSGQYQIGKNIAICSVVTDPNGLVDISGVYADIYYPNGIALGPNYTPLPDQSGLGCGRLMQENRLTQLSKMDGIDLFCNKIRNQNNNLPTFNAGDSYNKICATDGELMKDMAAVYCGEQTLSYSDPAGDYKVEVVAQDKMANTGVLDNQLTYLPLTAFETDFFTGTGFTRSVGIGAIDPSNAINYGTVSLDVNKIIPGDLIWSYSSKPTIRNVGNTRLNINIMQDDMGLGKTASIWNVHYDARIGNDPADWTHYDPMASAILKKSLNLSETNEMDFSILVSKFPAPLQNVYTGTMTLNAIPIPYLNCDALPQNQPPIISSLKQYKSDGVTEIPEGGETSESTVILKTTFYDPDLDSTKIQVEVRKFNEPFTGIEDGSIFNYDYAAHVGEITIPTGLNNLTDGPWHWRVKAIDGKGNTSGWQEFGQEGNIDFIVNTLPPPEVLTTFHNNAPSSISTAPTISDPVNSVFGNYLHQKRDIYIPSRGLPLLFERTYNSQSQENGPLGEKWTNTYNAYLKFYDQAVVSVNPDGRWDLFTENADGTYSPQKGVYDELKKKNDGSFDLIKKDKTKYHFDKNGKLFSIADRNGNALALSYDSNGHLAKATDSAGRSLDFTSDSDGRITEITDPAGQKYLYAYDASGNLVSYINPAGGKTSYSYDDRHNLISITDANGHVLATNTYDDQNRVVAQKDANGNEGKFSYDKNSKVTVFTNSLGAETKYYYDDNSRVIKTVDAEGNATVKTFDENSNLLSLTNARGNTTQFSYDGRGNVTDIINALGNKTSFTYDGNDNLSSAIDPKGNKSFFEYDTAGNLTKTVDASGNETAFAYDSYGELISAKDARGSTTNYAYDNNGNIKAITDALGNSSDFVYDILGRPVSLTDPLGNTSKAEYDPLGRIVKTIDPLNNQTTSAYDSVGNLLKNIDAQGNTTVYAYDAKNDLVKVQDALGNNTNYQYDTLGNLTEAIDANSHATTYTYDSLERLVKSTDASGKTSAYAYDANGNIFSFINGKGENISYAYDPLNRLLEKNFPDGSSASFSYDENGRLIGAKNQNISYTYEYDALNRLISSSDSRFGTVSYTYDQTGNRVSLTDPQGRITRYRYDELNLLKTIADFENHAYSFKYDALGRRTGLSLPNGIATRYSYDAASRLLNLKSNNQNNDIVSSFAYSYDAIGNRLSKEDLKINSQYQYDVLSRILQTSESKTKNNPEEKIKAIEAYTYDSVGNRLTGPDKESYAYSSNNELLQAGNITFAYDDNGNAIAKQSEDKAWNFKYDPENRLLKAKVQDLENSESLTAIYKYDPFGRRIEKDVSESDGEKIERYLYDGDNILEIYDDKGLVSSFTQGSGIDEHLSVSQKGAIYYYLSDGLGSVITLADSKGKIIQKYEYDTFGNLKQEGEKIKQLYAFTGREYDKETGLYYYRARYYDSETGRFISRDSFTGFAEFPLSMNRYIYVLSNPLRYRDPSGHSIIDDIENIGTIKQITTFMKKLVNTLSPSDQASLANQDYTDYTNKCYGPEADKYKCDQSVPFSYQGPGSKQAIAVEKVQDFANSAPDIINLPLPSIPGVDAANTIIDLFKDLKNLLIPAAKAETKPLGASKIW